MTIEANMNKKNGIDLGIKKNAEAKLLIEQRIKLLQSIQGKVNAHYKTGKYGFTKEELSVLGELKTKIENLEE